MFQRTSNQSLLSTPVAHMVSPEPSFDPSSVSPVPVNLGSDPIGVSNMKNVGLRKQIYLVSSFLFVTMNPQRQSAY